MKEEEDKRRNRAAEKALRGLQTSVAARVREKIPPYLANDRATKDGAFMTRDSITREIAHEGKIVTRTISLSKAEHLGIFSEDGNLDKDAMNKEGVRCDMTRASAVLECYGAASFGWSDKMALEFDAGLFAIVTDICLEEEAKRKCKPDDKHTEEMAKIQEFAKDEAFEALILEPLRESFSAKDRCVVSLEEHLPFARPLIGYARDKLSEYASEIRTDRIHGKRDLRYFRQRVQLEQMDQMLVEGKTDEFKKACEDPKTVELFSSTPVQLETLAEMALRASVSARVKEKIQLHLAGDRPEIDRAFKDRASLSRAGSRTEEGISLSEAENFGIFSRKGNLNEKIMREKGVCCDVPRVSEILKQYGADSLGWSDKKALKVDAALFEISADVSLEEEAKLEGRPDDKHNEEIAKMKGFAAEEVFEALVLGPLWKPLLEKDCLLGLEAYPPFVRSIIVGAVDALDEHANKLRTDGFCGGQLRDQRYFGQMTKLAEMRRMLLEAKLKEFKKACEDPKTVKLFSSTSVQLKPLAEMASRALIAARVREELKDLRNDQAKMKKAFEDRGSLSREGKSISLSEAMDLEIFSKKGNLSKKIMREKGVCCDVPRVSGVLKQYGADSLGWRWSDKMALEFDSESSYLERKLSDEGSLGSLSGGRPDDSRIKEAIFDAMVFEPSRKPFSGECCSVELEACSPSVRSCMPGAIKAVMDALDEYVVKLQAHKIFGGKNPLYIEQLAKIAEMRDMLLKGKLSDFNRVCNDKKTDELLYSAPAQLETFAEKVKRACLKLLDLICGKKAAPVTAFWKTAPPRLPVHDLSLLELPIPAAEEPEPRSMVLAH